MSYSSEVLADSPLAYFRLGETSGTSAADSSGNSWTGTYNGSITLGATGLLVGDADKAADFASGYVSIPYFSALNAASAFTAEGWVNADTVSGDREIVQHDEDASPLSEMHYRLRISGGKAQAIAYIGGNVVVLSSVATLATGTTYHLAATYDGTTLRLYVNGALDNSSTPSGSINLTSNVALYIGSLGFQNAERFDGRIDEVAVYGTALSSTRIAAHYAAGTASTPARTAAVAVSVVPSAVSVGVAVVAAAAALAVTPTATAVPVAVVTGNAAITLTPSADATGAVPGMADAPTAVTITPTATAFAVYTVTAAAHITVTPSAVGSDAGGGVVGPTTITITPTAYAEAGSRTNPATGGRVRDSYAVATWDPPIVDPPDVPFPEHAYVSADAYTNVTMNGTRPTLHHHLHTQRRRHRDRIVIAGRDITYWRGIPTPIPAFGLVEPLLYGSGSLELPQVVACYETPGVGGLSWLVSGASVQIQRVKDTSDGPVVIIDWRGILLDFDTSGRTLTVGLAGDATGRAALLDKQPPIFKRRADLGYHWWDDITDIHRPFHPPQGPSTGITLYGFGGMRLLDHMQQLSAKGVQVSGTQWTCMPTEGDGTYRVIRKDTTTIDATAYLDDALTVASLRRDPAEEPNRVFATGVTPGGRRVKFGVYPVLAEGAAVPFPNNDGSSIRPGDTDADTDSGGGVTAMLARLYQTGYLTVADRSGGYDGDAGDAVRDLRDDAGLLPLFTDEGPRFYSAAFKHNKPFATTPSDPNYPYQSALSSSDETAFEHWVNTYNIPFDLSAHIVDYDMRGFWNDERPTSWTEGDHFPDTWKTPYDTTFSHESVYSIPGTPFVWHGDYLVDERDDTQVYADPPTTKYMTKKAWDALFSIEVTGFNINGSHIEPAAQRDNVRRYLRDAAGNVIGQNPNWDRHALVVDKTLDMGTGITHQQMHAWAREELAPTPGDPGPTDAANNWVGTITFNTGGLIHGHHHPGDPVEVGNVMHARELRPGMNIWLPLFDGGTLLHVSGVNVAASTGLVSATVDTQARDTMKVWEVIARNVETRRDPARAWMRDHRSSRFVKDAVTEFDEVGGLIGDVDLPGGWKVFPVVAGQEGTIARLRLTLAKPAEFVVAVFGHRITRGRLAQLIGNPLDHAGAKHWDSEKVRRTLDRDYITLYVAGDDQAPCGYYPGVKQVKTWTPQVPNPHYNVSVPADDPDFDNQETIPKQYANPNYNPADPDNDQEFLDVVRYDELTPLTGRWDDDASFGYRTFDDSCVLWVALYTHRPNTLTGGRIMWPQLEAGS